MNKETKVEILQNQLETILDKLWKIFSWTSTIFIAIIGGVFALNSNSEPIVELTILQHVLIIGVIVTLVLYANGWLKENLNREKKIRLLLRLLLEDDKIKNEEGHLVNLYEDDPIASKFGYRLVVFILGLVAIIANVLFYYSQLY